MLYSIIIPTYNNLEECLKPCLNSLIEHTDGIGDTVEVIVVANGCTDGTEEYVRTITEEPVWEERYPGISKGVKLLSYTDPLGYTKAINTGLGVATGKFVVLLNNDTVILDFAKRGEWLDMLHDPFDPFNGDRVGITGPSKLFSNEAQHHFMVFFCVMIPRRLFFEIGYLDETFNPGGSEDIDFCMRLEQAGYQQVRVPGDGDEWSYTTDFPIYHKGEATVHNPELVNDWEEGFARRTKIIKDRTNRAYYSNFADVTCEISTKGRYTTTLPLTIMSIAQQELKPKRVLIFQDDYNPSKDAPKDMGNKDNDMAAQDVYKHLLTMLTNAGIDWHVIYGEGQGQVLNHQKALEMAETEWVWRMDDDNYAEADVLRKLMDSTSDGIVAVAPSVADPMAHVNPSWSTKMVHINTHSNVQWIKGTGTVSAEHLYSTFIYRRSAGLEHGYDLNLSPVGHREESIFTYNLFRDGGKLLVNRDATTWHLRMDTGGIRSHSDRSLWSKDEAYFRLLCEQWGIKPMERLWINMDGGRGDHYMLRMALPEIKAAHLDKLITVASAFPECLEGEDGVDVTSVADGMSNVHDFGKLNVYQWCMANGWNESLVEAFKRIYI